MISLLDALLIQQFRRVCFFGGMYAFYPDKLLPSLDIKILLPPPPPNSILAVSTTLTESETKCDSSKEGGSFYEIKNKSMVFQRGGCKNYQGGQTRGIKLTLEISS